MIQIETYIYLFEAAVEVELPPVQVISVEGEVVILSAVTGVGQHVPATFGKAQEDVPVTAERQINQIQHSHRSEIPVGTDRIFSSPCSEELLTDDGLQRDADTWREFPEEPLREMPIQLTDIKRDINTVTE